MKKIVSIVVLLFVCVANIFAQDNTAKKGEKDNLNLQIMFGPNFSQNENMDASEQRSVALSKNALAFDASIALAKEFTPCWGWRLSIGESQNKGRLDPDYKTDGKIFSFHDAELFGDLTLDLMDLFASSRDSKSFNIKLFGGVGGLYTFGFSQENAPADVASHLCFGVRGGLDLRLRISDKLSIGAEASAVAIEPDNFNGIVYGFPFDARISGKLGLIWSFGE